MIDRSIARLRDHHLEQRSAAISRYREQSRPEYLLARLSHICDRTLQQLVALTPLPANAALVAVGGYGRGELYPQSDVDVLILLDSEPNPTQTGAIENLVAAMWDLGLEPAHSVRTIKQCRQLAAKDVTTETALLEARWLAGSRALVQQLLQTIREQLDPQAFFLAKCTEMRDRHAHYHDTPYALEPNCKESPGALRDLQLLRWLAQAAGYGSSWREVADSGALTPAEHRSLRRAERAFAQLRIELHLMTGRREDRVLFDLQPALADIYGIQATKTRRASELLMQRYYWAARVVSQLSTILVQSIEETLFPAPGTPMQLNDDFRIVHGRLDVQRDDGFSRNPALILRAFLYLQQHPELSGMTARTLRAIWHARRRIDAQFRHNPINQDMFLRILKQSHGVADTLYSMTRLNILPRYLPVFRRIVGQMQHDLFHAYTVDEHTLKVIRNLRRFLEPDCAGEYPLASQLMNAFEQPWLLYIAALFHDIAKGRGGDHARLGAVEVRRFCRQHRLEPDATELTAFLVEHHLRMSTVAQKCDLSDPRVIHDFAAEVNDEQRLNALYLLTVADMRATSPTVWNSWRGKLLEDLHQRTLIVLGGMQPDTSTVLARRKQQAAKEIQILGIGDGRRDAFWNVLDTEYFLRHEPNEMAWHAEQLVFRLRDPDPVVRARVIGCNEALEVLVYTKDRPDLFATLCHFFDRNTLNVQEARIHTTQDGWALDSFIVLADLHHTPCPDRSGTIQRELAAYLRNQIAHTPPAPRYRYPGGPAQRQARTFPILPQAMLQHDDRDGSWSLSIVGADRAGLLYDFAVLFSSRRINLKMAKIHTLGERVEDTFILESTRLSDPAARQQLEHDALAILDQSRASHPITSSSVSHQ